MGHLLSKSRAQGSSSSHPYVDVFDSIQNGKLDKLQLCASEIPQFLEATKDGKSLLHWSVLHAQASCVEFLLQKGMDVNIPDKWKNTPVVELANCKVQNPATLRHVIDLLIKAKVNINATNSHNRTVLLLSIIHFRHQASEILLDLGADTNIGDVDGLRPLHVCATYSALPLLRKVIYNKADINAQDRKERTALYFAVLAGHQQIVEELLQHSVDVNLGSQFGCPLQTAIVKCKYEMVLALIEYGACVTFTVAEQRQLVSKAKDCLNLALIALHVELGTWQTETAIQNSIPKDGLIRAVQILDLIVQSYGDEVNVLKNLFFISGKPRFIFSLPDVPLFRKMKKICRQLQFLHGMSHNYVSLPGAGLPKLESITECRSLQNLCRMKVRKLIMRSNSNVVHAVKKLDCTVVVKDILLLKDIQ